MDRGYDVFEINTSRTFEIQRCDESSVYKNDRDANIAALNDAMNGDMQAVEFVKSVLVQESPLRLKARP